MVASDQSPSTNHRSPPSGHSNCELYLPNMHPVTIEEPSCHAMITMENSLDKV